MTSCGKRLSEKIDISSTMGELRVWVDGVERVVRGANEETTCENILLALASATGKLGRFALLEKWRDLERILPREAKPIKCLQMWGKQASEVKFVLKLMKDQPSHFSGKRGTEEHGLEEQNLSAGDDPFHRSFERKSLERLVANQSNKIKRLDRDLEILQLRIDSSVEDEESYLYFTEEEINEDRITRLGQVLKLQSKELAVEESCLVEIAKESKRHEELQIELQDLRSKLQHLDVHISDLENVGSKIYSMRFPQDTKLAVSQSLASVNSKNDLEEIAQEVAATREELTKQRDLAERQVEEVAHMKRSLAELENLSREKSFHLLALKGEPSPELSLSYYDLDKNLELGIEQDVPINGVGGDELRPHRDLIKLTSPVVPRSSSRDGTQADLFSRTPSARRSPSREPRFLVNGMDDSDDPGVFV